MTRYLRKEPFPVGSRDERAARAYRDNYDKVFAKRRQKAPKPRPQRDAKGGK